MGKTNLFYTFKYMLFIGKDSLDEEKCRLELYIWFHLGLIRLKNNLKHGLFFKNIFYLPHIHLSSILYSFVEANLFNKCIQKKNQYLKLCTFSLVHSIPICLKSLNKDSKSIFLLRNSNFIFVFWNCFIACSCIYAILT